MFGLLKHQAVTYFQSVVRATGATISIGQQGPGYRMYSFSRMLFHVRKALSYTSPGLMIYKDSYPSKKVNLGMLDPLPHSFRFQPWIWGNVMTFHFRNGPSRFVVNQQDLLAMGSTASDWRFYFLRKIRHFKGQNLDFKSRT